MSVLSAVAFLNTSEERLDQQQRGRSPSPISASINNNKPTTEAAIKELNRIRTGGGSGVASLLSKFGNDTNVARPPPPPSPSPRAPLSPTSLSTTTTILKSNDRSAVRSPSPTTTPVVAAAGATGAPVSKPKPRATTVKNGLTRTQVDMLTQELTTLYQESAEKAEAAEQELEQLKEQIATYEADSTKVRDYEIRVEYLAQKLEQVSEERDGLEQELRMYRERQGTLDTPVSPVFQHRLSGIFDQQDKQPEQQQEQQYNENDNINLNNGDDEDDHSEFMHDILDAYEDDEDEESSFGIQSERHTQSEQIRGTIRYSNSNISNAPPKEQIAFLTEQLRAADEGTKIAVQHYLSELEQERLRTKTLQKVLKKQEDLITTLESKLVVSTGTKVAPRPPRNASLASPTLETSNNNNSLERALRNQVESQRLELEDKRALLTQLLNEREDMLKKVNLGASRPGASSFDILAEIARPPTTANGGNNQQQYLPYQRQQQSPVIDGRNTPPPTAPPRDPLPPVPPIATSTTSPSKSSARGSISSYHEESMVSSATSWSSSIGADYYGRQQQDQQKKYQPPASHNNFEAMYSNYLKDDMFEEENDPYLEALRRLEGPKQ